MAVELPRVSLGNVKNEKEEQGGPGEGRKGASIQVCHIYQLSQV